MIGSSHTPSQTDSKFSRIEIYKMGPKCIEAEIEVTAHPSGVISPTGRVAYSVPMHTKVNLEVGGEEILLQIRIPIRARTIGEAWLKFDEEVKANYPIGVQNELLRRGLVKAGDPVNLVVNGEMQK